ncbi:response regulator [Poseidonibacter antarcticus]|uniref:response regulator n=1 Tax=Poseidonibacter antarcticus TaxID=2478538 RepID=UPI000EF555C0|nr:response regulator [Poseidonibacter antarcticus]
MTKILIVEDEIIVALDTRSILKKLGYEITDIVTNYDETMNSISDNKPDIILMDINLKNSINGIEIAKRIKKVQNIFIIFISAFCDDETISQAVEVEPLGYLVKPFNRNDLKTTISLAIYKLKKDLSNSYVKNKIKLSSTYYYSNDDYLRMYYENREILITKNERLLFEVLIKNKGKIVSFTNIEHYIWPDKGVSDSTFRTLLYRLRSKFNHKLIETIPSLGCRLNIS